MSHPDPLQEYDQDVTVGECSVCGEMLHSEADGPEAPSKQDPSMHQSCADEDPYAILCLYEGLYDCPVPKH